MKSHVLALLALAAWLPLASLAGEIATSFPAKTRVVIRVDADKLRTLPVFQQFLTNKVGDQQEFFQTIKTWSGIDLDSVKEVWVGVLKKDHAVIVLKGDFDLDTIRTAVMQIDTAQVAMRPQVPFSVMLADDKRPGEFNLAALLDDSTVAIGRPELVDEYISSYVTDDFAMSEDRAAIAKDLAGSPWGVDVALFEMGPEELAKNPWMKLISWVRFRGEMKEDLALQLILAPTEEKAALATKNLLDSARTLYLMVPKESQKLKGIKEFLLKNVQTRVVEGLLLADVTMPGDAGAKLLGGILRKMK
ncbi:MAG: hypothetical protein KAI66_22145 [Lentisphaeria bacterium]|nr:hypothetical protein [Lentisphaeria bacterium]